MALSTATAPLPIAANPTLQAAETPAPVEANLGLQAGAARLVAALVAAEPGSALRFQRGTTADGRPAMVGATPDGLIQVEIIGPEDSSVTASVAALLPVGDAAAEGAARAALFQLIGAAMPQRAWAVAWLEARIEDALAGIPFSTTYEDHYAQVVRLGSPQPLIHLAVTLAPQTLTLPSWGQIDAPPAATVDPWHRLPIMAAPLRGQLLHSGALELYEYSVDATVEAVEAFYAQEMAAQGWEVVERAIVGDPNNPAQQQVVLVYRRGVEGAIVMIERLAALQETLVNLAYAENAANLPAIAG